MPFENFRDHFENGLHSSYYETYYLMGNADMDWTKLKTLVLKLSEVRERVLVDRMTSQTSLLSISQATQPEILPPRRPSPQQRGRARNWRGNSQNRHYTNDYRQGQNTSRGRGQYNSFGFTPNNRDQRRGTYRGGNRGAGRNNYDDRPTQSNYNRPNSQPLPNTRCNDGRPRCNNCNRCGHYSCGQERPERRLSFSRTPSPNETGRLN